MMNWVAAAAEWRNFRRVVRANWRKLTDVELAGVSGDRARLASRIQASYGLSSAQAEQQIRTFEARCEYFRAVSLR